MTIVWSITSGKRLILADGQEVHYSMARGTKLEFSWTMRGNHVLKVVAHAAPQVSATPGWRQYDLFIDGQSFFGMPKVYELGIKGPVASEARAPGVRSGGGGDARAGGGSGGGARGRPIARLVCGRDARCGRSAALPLRERPPARRAARRRQLRPRAAIRLRAVPADGDRAVAAPRRSDDVLRRLSIGG